MNIFNALGTGVDRLVGIFNPKREIVRRLWRERAESSRGLYAAAKTNRLTNPAINPRENINDLISASGATVRGRVQQLVRDFPYFKRAVNVILNDVVGVGHSYQSRIRKADGTLDKELNQQVEDAFTEWKEEADFSGKLHFDQIQRLIRRQDIESGEFIVVKRFKRKPGRFLPFSLQVHESEWLTDFNVINPIPGNTIDQGIEFDKDGVVVAYHFSNPDTLREASRVPANQVLHNFEFVRPGQLRGISRFHSSVLVARDLNDYMDAEIDAAKLASKWLAFVTTPDAGLKQSLNAISGQGEDQGKQLEDLENGIIEYLSPGEKIEFANANRPGGSFDPLTRFILRMIAISVDIPFERLSGDYSGMNFTTLRVGRNDHQQDLKPEQRRHAFHFCEQVKREFMTIAFLDGKLNLPGYAQNPRPFWRGVWTAPGMEPVDSLRQSKSNQTEMDNLIRSPQEIVQGRGRSLEDIFDEIEEADAMAESRGLSRIPSSTALANNPAAINNEGDQDEDRAVDSLLETTNRLNGNGA